MDELATRNSHKTSYSRRASRRFSWRKKRSKQQSSLKYKESSVENKSFDNSGISIENDISNHKIFSNKIDYQLINDDFFDDSTILDDNFVRDQEITKFKDISEKKCGDFQNIHNMNVEFEYPEIDVCTISNNHVNGRGSEIDAQCLNTSIRDTISLNDGKYVEHNLQFCTSLNSNFDNMKYSLSTCNNNNEADMKDYITYKNRLVVDLKHILDEEKKLFCDHAILNNCSFNDWTYLPNKSKQYGLLTQLVFTCKSCNYEVSLPSEPTNDPRYMDINTAAVSSTMTTGIGHTQLQELLAGIGVSSMSDKTYIKYKNKLYDEFTKAAVSNMKEAGKEARDRAIERGDISASGIPYITVAIDGSWMKRTYGSNYNSLSGMGSIVDIESEKVLFFAVRNKYCFHCAIAENAGIKPKEHKCFRNWNPHAPSTGMEAHAILEGFKTSVQTHGLIYKTIVSDGDSSVYKTIIDNNVYSDYNIVPERILCTNHLLRNLCKKLRAVAATTQSNGNRIAGFVSLRAIIESNINNIRKRVEELVSLRVSKNEPFEKKAEELRKDILNVPSHIFGEHKACLDRGDHCELIKEKNYVSDLQCIGLYQKVEEAIIYLSNFSDSLLHRLTNNAAESFNAHVCHSLGGKRINWGLTNQYNTRVAAATLQNNTQENVIDLHKAMNKRVPVILDNVIKQRKLKVLRTKERRQVVGRTKKLKQNNSGKYYGKKHQDLDKPLKIMDDLKKELLQELRENQQNRKTIEQDTVKQRNSPLWLSLRRKMLTSSNFKIACSWNIRTSCAIKVKQILYPSLKEKAQLVYGVDQEKIAKEELQRHFDGQLKECGLFIDPKFPMLAASPDALIGDDGIIEIKCPYVAANITAEQAINSNKHVRAMFQPKDINKINTNHQIYYQIQGQLHITGREYCVLVIHTPHSNKMIEVKVNHQFWKTKMEAQLIRFYMDCMLPEIIDGRYTRSMPIRNPAYTLDAIAQKRSAKIKSNLHISKDESALAQTNHGQCERAELPSLSNDYDDSVIYVSEHNNPETVPTTIEAFKKIFDERFIPLNEVISNVLPINSQLNDDSIDAFVRITQINRSNLISQSVNYIQMELPNGIDSVRTPSFQIIGGNVIGHWRCLHFDGERICIYDSLPELSNFQLSQAEKLYVSRRFPQVQESNISFVPMLTKQPDAISCGVYSVAFAATLCLGGNPSQVRYSQNVLDMRLHFVQILRSRKISQFPVIN